MEPYDIDIINVVYAPPELMNSSSHTQQQHSTEEPFTELSPSTEPLTEIIYGSQENLGPSAPSFWDEDQETEVYPYSHAATAPDTPSDSDNPIGDIYGGPDLLWDNKETGMDTVYGGPRGRELADAVNSIISKLKGDS